MLRRLGPYLARFSNRSYASQCGLPLTMKQILSTSTADLEPTITVHGWIRSVRPHKNVTFLDVNDGTTFKGLQAVLLQRSSGLTNGTSVRLTGQLIRSPGKGQERELKVDEVEVLGECDPELYPIQKKDLSHELLRDNAHLRARTASIAAALRMRGRLAHALSDWFEHEGFVHAHTPVITSIDCEGAGEAFRVNSEASPNVPSKSTEASQALSAAPTYLTTSTQLHLEALASSLSRVYTLAPSFRAERSQTNRHLNEFWMLEAEMSFLTAGLDSVLDVVEESLKFALRRLNDDEDVIGLRSAATYPVGKDVWDIWASPFPLWRRVTYTEVLHALDAHHASNAEPRFQFPPPVWGEALRSEHERWVAQTMGNSRGVVGGPVFVTDYPRALKPFYMWVNNSDSEAHESVACFDLLVPRVGEISGGSVRESRLDVLRQSMKIQKMDEVQHSWYLDLRRYGATPHGGFGIGFDRLVSWITGIENVRECIAFPRWAGRVLL